MVFSLFCRLLEQKTPYISMCFTPQKPGFTVLTMFCATCSRIHGICSVFETYLAKTLIFTRFSACCKKYFFICKKYRKHCNLQGFCFPTATKNRPRMVHKSSKTDLWKHPNFFMFFVPAPGPPKP
jgi:hypothetical protein